MRRAGVTGDPRENTLTSGIVRHESHCETPVATPSGIDPEQNSHGCAIFVQRVSNMTSQKHNSAVAMILLTIEYISFYTATQRDMIDCKSFYTIKYILLGQYQLGSPLVDDRPIMNAVKYREVSGVKWTNRTMHCVKEEKKTVISMQVERKEKDSIKLLEIALTCGIGKMSRPRIFRDKLADGNTARLARKSDEALGVHVSVARIAPSLVYLGRRRLFGSVLSRFRRSDFWSEVNSEPKQECGGLYSIMRRYADINCTSAVSCHNERRRLGQRSPGGIENRNRPKAVNSTKNIKASSITDQLNNSVPIQEYKRYFRKVSLPVDEIHANITFLGRACTNSLTKTLPQTLKNNRNYLPPVLTPSITILHLWTIVLGEESLLKLFKAWQVKNKKWQMFCGHSFAGRLVARMGGLRAIPGRRTINFRSRRARRLIEPGSPASERYTLVISANVITDDTGKLQIEIWKILGNVCKLIFQVLQLYWRARLDSRWGCSRIFARGNRAGDLPFPPPLHYDASPYSPRFSLIDSQYLDAKSRPTFPNQLSPLLILTKFGTLTPLNIFNYWLSVSYYYAELIISQSNLFLILLRALSFASLVRAEMCESHAGTQERGGEVKDRRDDNPFAGSRAPDLRKIGFLRLSEECCGSNPASLSQLIDDEREEERVAREATGGCKICDYEHRCNGGCDCQAGQWDRMKQMGDIIAMLLCSGGGLTSHRQLSVLTQQLISKQSRSSTAEELSSHKCSGVEIPLISAYTVSLLAVRSSKETGFVSDWLLHDTEDFARLPLGKMEQHGNEGVEETGELRENPPNSGIVHSYSHLQILGVTRPGIQPGYPWWEASSLTAQLPLPLCVLKSRADLSTGDCLHIYTAANEPTIPTPVFIGM
ncbi:hypothetical protein PR048_031696 [Dryococelus australis]|uniref:Uncharacterized protein n=1 Tax=Dryococelus australis TaxID=614101 RepID=A0ABQ9G614_9NEOP|nr:hypothetical protein PR048_031696 [Dryococelus australis]